MSARYQLSKRNHFVGVAVLLLLQFTTGGTTRTTSDPETTYSRSTNSQTASYSTTPTNTDTSYSSAKTNAASLYSSLITTNNTSDNSMTTIPDIPVISTTTRSDTSVSSTTSDTDLSVSSSTTSTDALISSTTTSVYNSVNRTTTSPFTSVSSTTTKPDTSVSNTTILADTSVSSTTTIPVRSVSSIKTIPDISVISTSHYTTISSTTTSPATSVSNTTRIPDESVSNTTTIPDISVSSTTTIPDSLVSSTTRSPDTSVSRTTSADISVSITTTSTNTSVSSTPDYHFSSSSTSSATTDIASITRIFVVDNLVNASFDDCATIGERFRFRLHSICDVFTYHNDMDLKRSDNLQRVYVTYDGDLHCDAMVIPVTDSSKFSLNCNSTEKVYILDINEVTGDDIGHNWTVYTDLYVISHSIPVRHCGSEDKMNTTSQECATLGKRFRLRATYDFYTDEFDIKVIQWRGSGSLIQYVVENGYVQASSYNRNKYSFYCNSSENVYYLELKSVTNDDLDVEWELTTWFDVVLEPIPVILCDCPDKYFGENCTQECDCNGEPCNTTTGICRSGCGNPSDIENGDVNFNTTITNSTAIYKCEVGHYLVGTSTTSCGQTGTWVGDIPKCQLVDCGEPTEVAHSLVNHNVTTFNATAIYTCAIGYNMTGDNSITCGEDSAWDGNKPVCRIVDCGFPIHIMNGRYTLVGTTTYSSIALYKCANGYRLKSTIDIKRCEADGTWQGEIGTCVRVECGRLSPADNGMVTYSGDNKTATFSCNSAFRLIGRDKLFCLSTGNWSETVPKCEIVESEIKHCQKDEDSRGTLWNETSPGQIVTSLCQEGQEGTISRQCDTTGDWKLPRYTCVKKEIAEAESKIHVIESSNITEAIKVGIVSDVLDTLSNSTTATIASVSAGMGDGEIEKVTSILERVASISQDIVVTEKQSEDFIGTTSNLLNQQNSGSFRSLEENKDQDGTSPFGADRVLEVVGNFARAIAKSLDKLNGSKTIQTDNMVVTVSKLDEDEDIQFPLNSSPSSDMNSSTSAEISHSGLKGIVSYSGIFYSNLSGLLSPRIHDKGSDDEVNFEINAAVIDMQLLNTTGTPPNFKINLNFDNFQGGNHETKCCFWNYNRSSWDTFGCKLETDKTNSSITVCTCNHTTNFAILTNPFKTQNVDSKVLDYISLVSCSISMVCLIVTIVVHAALWRYLKSDRAIILINLSIALILSYATFVFGADKTENKVVCTAVAVALHYIYLVVFFLMLSEGIEILITVVYVFVMKSRLRRLLLMSWGLPVIIVGTSVAVTQSDGYGSEEYCWLSVHSGIIWAFVGPALAIIIANFVQLCIVIKAMFKVRTLQERSRVEKVKTGVRCLCVLLPLTGGTWVIGMFYVDEKLAWIQYTFAVLNGLQGVFILLFHCITNSQIKVAVSRRMKLYRASTAYSRSSNNPTPRYSAPRELSSHRHERSTESYNDVDKSCADSSKEDSRDLIEDSFQSNDRNSH